MNEQHKLTAQMVAAYPNAQVVFRNTHPNSACILWDVREIHPKGDKIFVSTEGYYGFTANASDFQLVLTSPDKITDAQALEVAKEFFIEEWQTLEKSKAIFSNLDYDDDWTLDSAAKFTDICRSLNIDMGYKNIPSLIAAGLVVEKINDNQVIKGCPFDEQL